MIQFIVFYTHFKRVRFDLYMYIEMHFIGLYYYVYLIIFEFLFFFLFVLQK